MMREVVGGAPARRDHARLGLDAAAHLQRLQQRVAQPAVSSDSGMWMVPAEIGLTQIGAAALARLGDAERLEAPDRLADRRAADRQRGHQFALGRQPVAALQRGALDIVGQRLHDLLAAIDRGQRGDRHGRGRRQFVVRPHDS